MNNDSIDFINKYKSKYKLEIVFVSKCHINNTNEYNIFDINIKKKENEFINCLKKHTNPENVTIQRYYHEDKYMEVTDNGLIAKKKIIIDKILDNNILIIVYEIIDIKLDLIPGLNKYDKEDIEIWSKYNINNNQIILKSNKNNLCCYLSIENYNIEQINKSICLIKQIV